MPSRGPPSEQALIGIAGVGAGIGLVADLPRDRDEKATLNMDDALRRPSRPRGVRQEVRRLRVELCGRKLARRVGGELVPRSDDDVLDARRLAAGLFED